MRAVSPGWLETMKISLLDAGTFSPVTRNLGSALVNETFAKVISMVVDPVGKAFDLATDEGLRVRYQIVGLVRDVRYRNLREPRIAAPLALPISNANADSAARLQARK